MINSLFHAAVYSFAFLRGKLTFKRIILVRILLKSGNHVDAWIDNWEKTSTEISWVSHSTVMPRLKSVDFDQIEGIVHLRTRLTVDFKAM